MVELDAASIAEMRKLGDDIDAFPVGYFADDNKRGFFLFEYSKLTSKLVGSIKAISDRDLEAMVSKLDLQPDNAADAFRLHAKLQAVLAIFRARLASIERAGTP